MPLAIDSSLAPRPEPGPLGRAPEPAATPSEQLAFAGELERARLATDARPNPAPTLVPATRTRLSGDEAAQALRAAWTQVRGEPPSQETLSVLVGQWAHETGARQSMLNYNFGGLKGTGPSGLSAAYRTREGWGESEVRVVDRFRAYGSAEEGARDYVSLLVRRYPAALGAAEAGDARGFVHALKARGYFTDNEAAYAKSVESLSTRARLAGFDAVGTSKPGGAVFEADAASLAGMAPRGSGSAEATARLSARLPLAGGALLKDTADLAHDPLASLPVSSGAFADEVNRAALLMSALRIADPSSRRS